MGSWQDQGSLTYYAKLSWPLVIFLNIYISGYMDINEALTAFSALSNKPRLDAFRLLIKAGVAGMSSGQIGERLGAKQNSTSTNLSILEASGLISSTRQGRSVIYSANMDGIRGLLGFLMEDCCGGHPDICQPVLNEIACCD